MKKGNLSVFFLLASVLIMGIFSACDEEALIAENIRETIGEPVIRNFHPKDGKAGTEIMIEGENLATVNRVYIGNVETGIKHRISNSKILIKVIGYEVNGPVKIINNVGETQSSEEFSMSYVIPAITTIEPDVSALSPGDVIALSGSNFRSALNFYVGEVDAEVLFLNDTKVELSVPELEETKARVRIEHYIAGGTDFVESVKEFSITD